MDEDDNDFDFNFDDLSPEEQEELDREHHERQKRIKNHPLTRKGNEVYETVSALIESLPKQAHDMYAGSLMESALIISAKLAGAMGSDSWLICMQNASIIRYHAEYLHTSTSGLKAFTKADKNYVKVLRTTMEEFRDEFKKWVAEFSQLENDDFDDEWGLFNRN